MMARYCCNRLEPWMSLSVTYSGIATVGCCGFTGKPFNFDIDKGPNPPALWNSPVLQNLRRAFAENRAGEAGCANCSQYVPMSVANTQTITPPQANPLRNHLRQRNLEQLHMAAMAGDTELTMPPAKLALCFSPVCNLRCVMCSQEYYHKNIDFKELQADAILRYQDWLTGVDEIELCGGEVFASNQARRFINKLATSPGLQGVCLRIITNGQLVDKVIEDLLCFERAHFHVSLDGIGSVYEAVRVGGKWPRVEKNLLMLAHHAQSRPGWTLSTSAVLIRDAINGLPDLVKYCLDHGLQLNVQELLPTRNSFRHDLCNSPEARAAIPWREKLETARQMFEDAGYHQQARAVADFAQKVAEAASSDCNAVQRLDFEVLQDVDQIAGKRVMIWGTGSNYRLFFAKWLKSVQNQIVFLGFIDNNEEQWHQQLDGHQINAPGEVAQLAPDLIVLAVTLIWREPVLKQIRNLGLLCEVV